MNTKFTIPSDIEEEAKSYMENVVSQLEEKGILANVDSAALMMLARNYSMFIKANKQLEEDGLTIGEGERITSHPLIKVARDAQVQAVKIMTEFGLTAKARTKLEKEVPGKEEPSPLDKFLNNGKETR